MRAGRLIPTFGLLMAFLAILWGLKLAESFHRSLQASGASVIESSRQFERVSASQLEFSPIIRHEPSTFDGLRYVVILDLPLAIIGIALALWSKRRSAPWPASAATWFRLVISIQLVPTVLALVLSVFLLPWFWDAELLSFLLYGLFCAGGAYAWQRCLRKTSPPHFVAIELS